MSELVTVRSTRNGVGSFSISCIYMDFIIWPFYNCIGWKTCYRVHHLSVAVVEIGCHAADYGLLASARETPLLSFISKSSAAWGMCSFGMGREVWGLKKLDSSWHNGLAGTRCCEACMWELQQTSTRPSNACQC